MDSSIPNKDAALARAVSTADKVRFLSQPSAYREAPLDVTLVETHMSLVFLAGERAYKLKKPVRFPFLDFSTLGARENSCREEARLNRRLAPNVYLGTVPLRISKSGELSLGGEGAIVDWLVEMRRLPHDLMLDKMLIEGRLDGARLDALCRTLSNFYDSADRSTIAPGDYAARFFREQAESRSILTRRDFAVDHGRIPAFLDRLEASLRASRSLLEERVRARRVVDGHGDLRPQHICFTDPITIFDCLEFNSELRQVDPFDDLAFLCIECALLGAPSVGQELIAKTAQRLGEAAPDRLISLYAACRAVLRARLAIAHLLDPAPRQPEKWEPLANRYLNLAETALAAGSINSVGRKHPLPRERVGPKDRGEG